MEINREEWNELTSDIDRGIPFVKGAIVRITDPEDIINGNYGYICVKGGILNSNTLTDRPIFREMLLDDSAKDIAERTFSVSPTHF